MKFFFFNNPRDYRFAWASLREPWRLLERDEAGRPETAQMQWEADSEVVGDFIWWAACSDVVVKRSLAEELLKQFSGFELGPIAMFQDPKFDKLKRKPRKPRILLPYTGPELVYLAATAVVPVDMEHTSSSIEWVERDGVQFPRLLPVFEHYETRFENFRPAGEIHVPRESGKGAFVHAADVGGASIFQLSIADQQCPQMCCTEPVKDFIEQQGWTNVRFLEVGDVLEGESPEPAPDQQETCI
jgi:hypothetical protein